MLKGTLPNETSDPWMLLNIEKVEIDRHFPIIIGSGIRRQKKVMYTGLRDRKLSSTHPVV
jgi:hypothetical protein